MATKTNVKATFWHHVNAPTKGMIRNIPPTLLPKEASPYIKGMYLKDGEVVSDFGYTDYPVTSNTQTNALNGTVMLITQFFKKDGTSSLLCFTTTNCYKYNTSTETWDCITQGTLVENCEDAWAAAVSVTSTADGTIKLTGTNSSKNVIADAFTTGIVASEATGTLDLSAAANTHIAFWIRASAAVDSDVLRFRICEDLSGAATNTYNDFTIPALVADEWQHVIVKTKVAGTGTWPTDFNSVDSVALVANSDPGAITVYLDDIRTVKAFTGDEDDRFSVDTMDNTFVICNGNDTIQKYTGSGVLADLTTTLASGAITSAEVVLSAKDHLVFFNTYENGYDCPARATWSNIGRIEDYTGGTAGYQDLTDDDSWVMGAAQLSENEWAVYKERSIVKMIWVGGATPFRFYTMVDGTGVLNKDAIVAIGGVHVVFGSDSVYGYKGGYEAPPLDDVLGSALYDRLDRAYSGRVFLAYVEEDAELQIWIPTSTAYPDEVWCINMTENTWYIKDRSMTGIGFYKAASSLTIADLTGTIGEQNWKFGDMLVKANAPITLVGDSNGKVYTLNKTTLNNDGTAIVNEFQTPDFVLPNTEERMNFFMRVPQLLFEAKGQSITTDWSSDGGGSWNPTQGAAGNITSLDSVYKVYQQDFDTTVRKIRFRFRNMTASSGFYLRYYGFKWIPRSGRR